MAITQIKLRLAEKANGEDPTGTKVFLVGSDTNIGDDIDQILDASIDSTTYVPNYNEGWGAGDTQILVRTKRASAHDNQDGAMEGFWWLVTVDYQTPDSVQNEVDPRDRDWEWSKTDDKRELAIANTTFDTSGYVFPESDASNNFNLPAGVAFANTNGVPPAEGIPRIASRKLISMTKYIDDPTDLGVSTWEELDGLVDKVNDDNLEILDVTYAPREILVDSIPYGSVTENGFEVVRVTFNLVTDKEYKHVFSFASAGYEECDSTGGLRPIRDIEQNTVSEPQLLDIDGTAIPNPISAPFVKTPVIVNGGRHVETSLSALTLPTSIP